MLPSRLLLLPAATARRWPLLARPVYSFALSSSYCPPSLSCYRRYYHRSAPVLRASAGPVKGEKHEKTPQQIMVDMEEEQQKKTLKQRYKEFKPKIYSYAVMGSVGLGVLVIVRSGLSVLDYFSHMSIVDAGYYGFLTGGFTTLATGLTILGGSRATSISPEVAYRQTMKRVVKYPKVVEALGTDITTGKFRAYSVVGGHPRVFSEKNEEYDGWDRLWHPKSVQLVFQLKGSKGDGMVSAEICKRVGYLDYSLLTVDLLATGERIILEGSREPEKKIYRGVMRLR